MGPHVYAMVSRLAMLPAAFAIWIAAAGTSHDIDEPWGLGLERSEDQEAAASLMIGFGMILLCIAIVLSFIFVSRLRGPPEGSRAVKGVSRLIRRVNERTPRIWTHQKSARAGRERAILAT